jgi:hypothetical protein
MSTTSSSLLDRAARRVAGGANAGRANRAPGTRRGRPRPRHDPAPQITRTALLEAAASAAAARVPEPPDADRRSPGHVAEPLSRRTTFRLAAAAALAGSLLQPRAARAAMTEEQCTSACRTAHPVSLDPAGRRCVRGVYRTFGGFTGFVKTSLVVNVGVEVCIVALMAQDAYRRDQCIARCFTECTTSADPRCGAHLAPLSGPALKATSAPLGCGCVGSDTCCLCSTGVCADPSKGVTGMCCIYSDCRCVPTPSQLA